MSIWLAVIDMGMVVQVFLLIGETVISLGEGWVRPTLWTGGASTLLAHPCSRGVGSGGTLGCISPDSSILPNRGSEVRYQEDLLYKGRGPLKQNH